MSKCGECTKYLGGGDWDLCCKEKHEGYPMGFLCYEDTEACEKFDPIECACCDETGGVVLMKYPCTMQWQGKQITFERWSYHCNKCNRKFEPGWMFDRNLLNIRWERGKPEVADGKV